jgi:hypothetical protein
MKPIEIQVKIKCAEREANYWRDILRDKACRNCLHWQHDGCRLADGEVPPPSVQKSGCPAWEYDEIPF